MLHRDFRINVHKYSPLHGLHIGALRTFVFELPWTRDAVEHTDCNAIFHAEFALKASLRTVMDQHTRSKGVNATIDALDIIRLEVVLAHEIEQGVQSGVRTTATR